VHRDFLITLYNCHSLKVWGRGGEFSGVVPTDSAQGTDDMRLERYKCLLLLFIMLW
jgi:hypothetical protein